MEEIKRVIEEPWKLVESHRNYQAYKCVRSKYK